MTQVASEVDTTVEGPRRYGNTAVKTFTRENGTSKHAPVASEVCRVAKRIATASGVADFNVVTARTMVHVIVCKSQCTVTTVYSNGGKVPIRAK